MTEAGRRRRWRRPVPILLAVVGLVAGVVTIVVRRDGDPAARPPQAAPVVEPACAPTDPMAAALRARLGGADPGVGVADYPGFPTAEIPKAEAAVLLAEVTCAKANPQWDRALLDEVGERLLTWPSRHAGDRFGWGLPFAWDAFGDGTENPADTVYSVSTGVVVKALLDWAEISDARTVGRIDSVVDRALAEWLAPEAMTAADQLAYSLAPADRSFDVFNSSVMLAGQMARFASLGRRSEHAADYRAVADRVMTSLASRALTDRRGFWYWPYSVQEDTPNDLTHAGYVVDGVTAYVASDPAAAARLPVEVIASHLTSFVSDGTIGEPMLPWPLWRSPELTDARSRLVRLYDLGWTFFQVSQHRDQLAPLLEPLCSEVRRHRSDDGSWRRYPTDADLPAGSDPEIAEYVAYAYLGVVTAGRTACATPSPTWQEVPFVRYRTGGSDLTLVLDSVTRRARLLGGPHRLDVGAPGVPVAAFVDGDTTVAVVRRIPTSALVLARWTGDLAHAPVALPRQEDVSLMFRAGRRVGDALYLVVYDNKDRQNRLQRYVWSTLAFDREWVLPSVEDPAGATYEMEPRAFLVPTGAGIDVFAGTLHARLVGDRLDEGRLDGCVKALEVVEASDGAHTLCSTPEGDYAVVAPTGARRVVATTGVPYDLRVGSDGAVTWTDSSGGLAAWLEFEIVNGAGSGALELGVNNWEGRIPWSQVYYLNGLLDIVGAGSVRPLDPATRDLLPRITTRLRIEMSTLEAVLAQVGYESRAFTVDRSPGLFSVQTGRLALLEARYRTEVADPEPLPVLASIARQSATLVGHEEVIDRDGMKGWVPRGRAFLAWPKGSKFSYDGVNVPYNHQNEWAQGVLRSGRATPAEKATADDILSFFADRVLRPSGGRFPESGTWPYWWGVASDGWTESDGVSVNHPSYPGDRGEAWISFRTIDVESLLVWSAGLPADAAARLRESAVGLLVAGKLLPHVASTLAVSGEVPDVPAEVVHRFGRATTASELADAFWAQLLA